MQLRFYPVRVTYMGTDAPTGSVVGGGGGAGGDAAAAAAADARELGT
jgi:hypothetical protein